MLRSLASKCAGVHQLGTQYSGCILYHCLLQAWWRSTGFSKAVYLYPKAYAAACVNSEAHMRVPSSPVLCSAGQLPAALLTHACVRLYCSCNLLMHRLWRLSFCLHPEAVEVSGLCHRLGCASTSPTAAVCHKPGCVCHQAAPLVHGGLCFLCRLLHLLPLRYLPVQWLGFAADQCRCPHLRCNRRPQVLAAFSRCYTVNNYLDAAEKADQLQEAERAKVRGAISPSTNRQFWGSW